MLAEHFSFLQALFLKKKIHIELFLRITHTFFEN